MNIAKRIICRICMLIRNDYKNIFSIGCAESTIAENIMECAPVQISEEDGLPDKICLKCFEKLREVYQFRTMVINSDKSLRLKVTTETSINDDSHSNFLIFSDAKSSIEKNDKNVSKITFDEENEKKSFLSLNKSIAEIEKGYKDKKISSKKRSLKIKNEKGKKNIRTKISITKGKGPFSCEVCGKECSKLSNLAVHRRVHTGERPFVCDFCGRCFVCASSLTVHRRVHTGETPYECEFCGKKFIRWSGVIEHRRSHTGERPYQCDVCGRAYTQGSHLVAHRRTHTGERPYACDLCSRHFNTSQEVVKHRRTHTGERPYECDLCQRKFTQSASLKTHKRLVHKNR